MRYDRFLLLIAGVLTVFALPTMAQQRPDAPEYAQRGQYAVGTQEFSLTMEADRTLNGTIWYPAMNSDEQVEANTYQEAIAQFDGQALLDAEPDFVNAPYPLVIFSYGTPGIRFQSLYYVEHLASYGFVVMATEHPGSTVVDMLTGQMSEETIVASLGYRPAEILAQIDYAEGLTNGDGVFAGLIDTDNIGVAGHSFGGYTALSVGGAQLNSESIAVSCDDDNPSNNRLCTDEALSSLAAARGIDNRPETLWDMTTDERIKAIVPLAPSSVTYFGEAGLANITVPTLLMAGTSDPLLSDAHLAYESVASDEKYLIEFENAGHFIFFVSCNQQMLDLDFHYACSDQVWDMARAHDLINHFSTAFFVRFLQGDDSASTVLTAEAAQFIGVNFQGRVSRC